MRSLLAVGFLGTILASSPLPAEEIKVRIEASGDDAATLLAKLNEHGKEQKLQFAATDSGYRFRIAVAAESATKGDILFGGGADAAAAVLTPDCQLVFIVSRGGRTTKGGAMNALAKEIVKKMPQHLGGK